MHPCRTQNPCFSGVLVQITTVETTKIMKCLSENMWPITTAVTTLLVKSIQVTYDPKKAVNLSTWHCTPNTTATLWNHYFYSAKMTWTNYWQSGGQITDNEIRKRWSQYWLPSICSVSLSLSIYIYIYGNAPRSNVAFLVKNATFSPVL